MPYKITCPYCFKTMMDSDVHFRSDKVNQGEPDILPDEYDDMDDFIARYRGDDKESILLRLRDWSFFEETDDIVYEKFWQKFNGTTEVNPADDVLRVKAYRRRILNPQDASHQKYLKVQPNGSVFINDQQGMVTQLELSTGEFCNRRVCPHCHNPLPDNYGKSPVKFATIIGITGAGKTVYLSQLLRKMQTYAAKVGLTAVVNNPGVCAFLEKNKVEVNKMLPGSTPAVRLQQPLFYEMIRTGYGNEKITETFVLYDVAGEVFKDADLVVKFAPFIEHANGMVLLIDPRQFSVVHDTNNSGSQLSDPTTVLNTIHNIVSHGRTDEKCHTPLAVCISKVDTEEMRNVISDQLQTMLLDDVYSERDANGFRIPLFNARSYNPIAYELNQFFLYHAEELAQQTNTNYSTYGYFAFTALGCGIGEAVSDSGEPYQYPIGPVLPKRLEEPLLWLFYKLGYIDANEKLFSPVPDPIYCPACGSTNTYTLPENERYRKVKKGLWNKTVYEDTICGNCGERWVLT